MRIRRTSVLLAAFLALGCKGGSTDDDATDVPDVDEGTDADGQDPPDEEDGDAPPASIRALLLDLDLLHHSAWLDLDEAARAALVDLDYRRFYPHLTAADIEGPAPYDIVLVAGGGAPGMAAARLSTDERNEMVDLVLGGGVLVLLPQPTRMDSTYGENDWFVMNLVLEDLGSTMRIDKGSLLGPLFLGDPDPPHLDDETGYSTLLEFDMGYPWAYPNPETGLDEAVAGPLPGGRATVLRTGSPDIEVMLTARRGASVWIRTAGTIVDQIWNVTDDRPMAAVERIGEGYVAVVPRYLVTQGGAGGQISEHPALSTSAIERTPVFISWLVRRLASLGRGESTLVPTNPSGGDDALFCSGAPGMPPRCSGISVTIAAIPSTRPVPEAPPAGDLLEEFVESDPADPPPTVPLFSGPTGRLGYGGMPWDAALAATYFSEAASLELDALVGGFTPERLTTGEMTPADADAMRAKMAELADVAEAQGARWLVGGYYTGHVYNSDPTAFPRSVGAQDQVYDAPPLLHDPLWDDYLIPAAVEVATVAADHPGIAGILVDMEMYGTVLTYTDAQAFDDTTFGAYLDTLDPATRALLEAEPLSGRLDALIDGGLLGDFFEALTSRAAAIGSRYRAAVEAVDPDFAIALYFPGYPTAWQYRGLILGLGTTASPVMVLTYDPFSHPARADAVATMTSMVHIGGPIVSHFPPSDLTTVLDNCSLYTDGFWYFSHDEISQTGTSALPHGSRDEYRAAIASAE